MQFLRMRKLLFRSTAAGFECLLEYSYARTHLEDREMRSNKRHRFPVQISISFIQILLPSNMIV